MKSIIEHERTCMGCLVSVKFGKRVVIGYFSGTVIYRYLYSGKDWDTKCAEGVMSVKVKKF